MTNRDRGAPGTLTVFYTSMLVALAALVNLALHGGGLILTSAAAVTFALAAVNAVFAFNTWRSNRRP